MAGSDYKVYSTGGESSKVDTTALFGVIQWKQAAAEYFK